MSLKDAFYGIEKKPMLTIQKSINRRPHIASKFFKSKGKPKVGRKPKDIRPRYKEPIPPFHEVSEMHHSYDSKPKK